MTAVEWLTVGGPVEPWRRLGLFVTDDGLSRCSVPGCALTGDG